MVYIFKRDSCLAHQNGLEGTKYILLYIIHVHIYMYISFALVSLLGNIPDKIGSSLETLGGRYFRARIHRSLVKTMLKAMHTIYICYWGYEIYKRKDREKEWKWDEAIYDEWRRDECSLFNPRDSIILYPNTRAKSLNKCLFRCSDIFNGFPTRIMIVTFTNYVLECWLFTATDEVRIEWHHNYTTRLCLF